MASKKKGNGCRTIECVEQAVQACVCTLDELFACAAQGGFNVKLELEKFKEFKAHGIARYPHYRLPQAVINLVGDVQRAKCPRNYFRNLYRPVSRPPASAPVPTPA